MKGIIIENVSESLTRAKVLVQHFQLEDVPEEFRKGFIIVDDILPEPPETDGIAHALYVNPKTMEQWYEAEEVPLPENEMMKRKINAIQNVIDEFIFGGMM